MNAEQIEYIYESYLTSQGTDYAILINGEWGSGKTYFWKNNLVEISESNGFKPIYISLNGISRIEQLHQALFIQMLPLRNATENKRFQNSIKFIYNVANITARFVSKSGFDDLVKGIGIETFSFSQKVLCFDDMERCQISEEEILGFVNNLLEHQGAKIVLLAHEDKISSKYLYDGIKEKVIGRVLNFELEIERVIPKILGRFSDKNPAFYQFLEKNHSGIINTIQEYKQRNLRTINFFLDILERIYPLLNDADQTYVDEVVLFALIISIEFKKGHLSSTDFEDFKGLDDVINFQFFKSVDKARLKKGKPEVEETKSEKTLLEQFYETYLVNRNTVYHFYPSVYVFILTGFFDKEKFVTELNGRKPEGLSQEIKELQVLLRYQFRELENVEFSTLAATVLEHARSGKYHIYDYSRIGNFYYFFSKNSLIGESHEQIQEAIMAGLEISKGRKEIDDRVLENLLHFTDEAVENTLIKNRIKEIHDDIKKERYIENGNELITCIQEGSADAMASLFQKHEYSKDLFQYVDSALLIEAIVKTSNKNIFNFTEQLKHRYRSSNIGSILNEDIKCMMGLKEGLEGYLKISDDGQPRRFLIETLKEELTGIIARLNFTKGTIIA